jgi:hypothetical protein
VSVPTVSTRTATVTLSESDEEREGIPEKSGILFLL